MSSSEGAATSVLKEILPKVRRLPLRADSSGTRSASARALARAHGMISVLFLRDRRRMCD